MIVLRAYTPFAPVAAACALLMGAWREATGLFDTGADGAGPPSAGAGSDAPAIAAPAAATVPDGAAAAPALLAALRAAAPAADPALWGPVLAAALPAADITTPRRIAAFLGQCAVEAGPGFAELAEDTNYIHAERLLEIFPSHFANLEDAQAYVGQPERIANRVYAGVLGNGDEASGDGWTFRGSGLLQLTGREEIGAFAASVGITPEAAADLLRQPGGAARGACWYWATRAINPHADAWDLAAITRAVNGAAMLDHNARVAASQAALRAMED
jgi:putative chitinase